mmetsp:Transcript_18343/g.32978  ORF Transcript_18343/g.32978 Transcript_18343/m.32978 type:complete len:326 (+) Transcript_18343:4631-5608(+)
MKLTLVVAIGLLCFASASSSSPREFVGGRWEYWNFWRDNDFGSKLKNVPVSDTCRDAGYNPVIISYTDWQFNEDGNFDPTFKLINDQVSATGKVLTATELKAEVKVLRDQGADVYIEVGGTFSFGSILTSKVAIKKFVADLLVRIDFYRLKGVLFSQISIDSASVMVSVIQELRKKSSKVKIIYQIPAFGSTVAPWKDVVPKVKDLVTYIQVDVFDYYSSAYDTTQDFVTLASLGVDYKQMIYGVMPGCSHNNVEFTSIRDAKDIAKYVAENGLAGIVISTINRDTNHRTDLDDCVGQTGKPDGQYSKVIREALCKADESFCGGS